VNPEEYEPLIPAVSQRAGGTAGDWYCN